MKYQVRFHLARGEHYMHWQIRASDGSVRYIDPSKYQIEMTGCKLINKIGTARRVHNNGVKDVCGWVECDNYWPVFNDSIPVDNLEKLYYNPIRDIHWRRDGDDGDYSWDDCYYDSLVTNGRQVHVLEEVAMF